MQSLFLTTSDNVKISASEFLPDQKKYPKPKGWVLFLHMMPATKESWKVLADRLQQEGYVGLAIDLRGHGASDDGPVGYRGFSDAEHQDSIRDVDVGIDILHALGARDERITLIGASIGANLALQYASQHRTIASVVAISPGLNYHGIASKPFVEQLIPGKRLFLIASQDDDRVPDNAEEVIALYDAVPEGVIVGHTIVDVHGHGTNILVQSPEIIDEILTFIQQ